MMNANATGLIRSGDAVVGVTVDTPEGPVEIRASLTIGCDGRHSIVREHAGLEVEEIGAPMDVLWFRAGQAGKQTENLFGRVQTGKDAGHLRPWRLLAMRLRHRQRPV